MTDQLSEESVQDFVEQPIEEQLAFLFESQAALIGFLCHVFGEPFVEAFNRIAPNCQLEPQGEPTDG